MLTLCPGAYARTTKWNEKKGGLCTMSKYGSLTSPKLLMLSVACSIMYLLGCGTASSSRLLCQEADQPFVVCRGKTVHLKRPLKIYLSKKEMEKADKDGAYLSFSDPPYQPQIGGTNAIPSFLPAGTKIKLGDCRRDREYFVFLLIPFPYSLRYPVYFTVPEMGIRPDADFEYFWGKGLYLHRAPWEDESVPESRYVGFNGRGFTPNEKNMEKKAQN
jgi:hypothetical protein